LSYLDANKADSFEERCFYKVSEGGTSEAEIAKLFREKNKDDEELHRE
jgi:hypothetical protein